MSDDGLRWIKSSWSGNQGNCVELAFRAGKVLVRDSKLGENSSPLSFAEGDMARFVHAVGNRV